MYIQRFVKITDAYSTALGNILLDGKARCLEQLEN